ncbi:hypothetical protein FACS1894193_00480 [Bacilli bacterium]|nr:hypothetical protein FACS1894193_00480 [Bacilli bacterium]GHU46397.1 hypothetical protein FACS1894194_4000 [Bacilli bacterium]
MPKLKRKIINHASIFAIICGLVFIIPKIAMGIGILFLLYQAYLFSVLKQGEVYVADGCLCYYEKKFSLFYQLQPIRLPLCEIKNLSLFEENFYSGDGDTIYYYYIKVWKISSETILIGPLKADNHRIKPFISDVTRYKKNIEKQLTALVTVLTKIHGGDK